MGQISGIGRDYCQDVSDDGGFSPPLGAMCDGGDDEYDLNEIKPTNLMVCTRAMIFFASNFHSEDLDRCCLAIYSKTSPLRFLQRFDDSLHKMHQSIESIDSPSPEHLPEMKHGSTIFVRDDSDNEVDNMFEEADKEKVEFPSHHSTTSLYDSLVYFCSYFLSDKESPKSKSLKQMTKKKKSGEKKRVAIAVIHSPDNGNGKRKKMEEASEEIKSFTSRENHFFFLIGIGENTNKFDDNDGQSDDNDGQSVKINLSQNEDVQVNPHLPKKQQPAKKKDEIDHEKMSQFCEECGMIYIQVKSFKGVLIALDSVVERVNQDKKEVHKLSIKKKLSQENENNRVSEGDEQEEEAKNEEDGMNDDKKEEPDDDYFDLDFSERKEKKREIAVDWGILLETMK